MAVDVQSEEGRVIRQLIPLSKLPSKRFEALCAEFMVEEAEDGAFLFKCGDTVSDLFYLVKGAVSLETEALKIETIIAGTDSARFAVAHQIPRKVNAVANGKIRFLRLSPDMIKSAQDAPYEESESYMIVDESADDDDWMTTLLKSPIFRVLPPSNLQKILMGLEEVHFEPGEVIIAQGDPGDFYYIVKKGQCLISRKPMPNAKEIKLGQLSDQDTFGEDALISGEPRNVSITALTGVSLLRLSKEKFVALIKQPVLKYVHHSEVEALVAKGATLIDVRSPDEYQKNHLPRSVNLPFFSLRMQLKSINRSQPVVVVCANGKASETAAFFLLRNRYNALILKGGMASIPDQPSAPASFMIDDGIETGNFIEPVSISEPVSQAIADEAEVEEDAEKLRLMIQKLKTQCGVLQSEKKALEQQCSTLVRQLEALKEELKAVQKD